MDTKTFAQKIKAKYPAYQNVDDATLVKKFIEKYPEYKSQVNVQSETSQDISQTGSAIANTVNQGVDKYSEIQARQDAGLQGGLRTKLQQLGVGAGTASGVIGDVLTGAVKTVLPQSAENAVKSGLQTVTKPIIESAPVQSIMSKYEELKQTNPKLAQDISSALGFAQLGLDVTGIGETAGLAKTGIKKGVQLAETGVKDIAQAGSELATGVEKLGTAITPKPEEIMNRVARLTPSDATKFEALAGKSHGQYLKETGNFGTPDEIVKREAEKFVQSMNEADNALASLPGEYKSPSIDVAASELVDKAKRVSAPGIDSPILARATELQNKANTTGLTMSEVNELKRLYEKNVKLGYNKLMNADAVERATNIDNALRNWQFGKAKELGFSNLDELNKQTQLSKFMVDKLGNQILGKSGNNAMGLTDWIMVSGGDPTAIGGLLVKKFFSSEKVQSRIAKMLTKEAPSELKTATINKPINNIGSYITGTTRSKPSQQLLEGKQLKKALPTVSRKNGIMSSDLSTGVKKAYNNAKDTLKTLKDKNVRERGSISLEILPERKPKGNQGVSLAKNTTEDLLQQAKKYKSAEEFVKAISPSYSKLPDSPLYHGTSANIKNGKLTFGVGDGAKKGGQSGGHFLSDSKQISETFAGNNGKVYIVDPSYKKSILDLTKPKGVKEVENYIGNKYKTYDGEILEFTRDDFETMFPGGKTDFASISQYPELIEQITKRKGYKGIAFDEYAGGKTGKTYQILHSDNIPVIEQKKISDSELSKLIKEKTDLEPKATDLRLEEYGRNQDGYLTDSQINELYYLEKRMKEIDNILISSDYKSQLEEIWKKANKTVEIEPLIQEAKKYKSADEFANKQINAFHQSQSKTPFTDFKQRGDTGYKKASYSQAGEGIYFSPNKNLVQSKYGTNGGQLIESMLTMKKPLELKNFDAMYFDGRKVSYGDIVVQNAKREMRGQELIPEPDIVLTNISKKAKKWLKERGYDSVTGMEGEMFSAPEYVVFDKSQIKTKSQLEDIWKKANKK